MVETIILALIAAKLRKYKISGLFKDWAVYPVVLCAIVYTILEYMVFHGNFSFLKYTSNFKLIYLLLCVILIAKYKLYLKGLIGAGCVVIGTVLNNIAIAANNGKMPVFPSLTLLTGYIKSDTFIKGNDGLHILGGQAVKLKMLTDIFDVGYSVMSLGDIFIRTFVFIVIYFSVKGINEKIVSG